MKIQDVQYDFTARRAKVTLISGLFPTHTLVQVHFPVESGGAPTEEEISMAATRVMQQAIESLDRSKATLAPASAGR